MTRQTWTALVSAVCFVTMALGIALLPIPFVVYGPGGTYDLLGPGSDKQPMVGVEGMRTYPTTGSLDMTTVSVSRSDAKVSLPEAVLAYWAPHRDAMPRDSIYDQGKSPTQVKAEEQQKMDISQQDAVVSALRAAGQPVEELPVVASVSVTGPSNGRLKPGDLVLKLNGESMRTVDDVVAAVQRSEVGSEIKLTVWREQAETTVGVVSVPSFQNPRQASVGVNVATGYRYPGRVRFGVGHDIGGPSAGLAFALAIYDKVTPGDLLAGRRVAGTGTISGRGAVGPIGGLQEKLAGAEKGGASTFLVPAANCRDLAGIQTKLDLIRVDSLQGAVEALNASKNPATAHQVPRC